MPDSDLSAPTGLSRRSMMVGSALGALLVYAFARHDTASAATAWTYPFTTRGRMSGAFDPNNTWDYKNGHKGTDYHQAYGRDATVRAIGIGTVVYTGGGLASMELGNVVVIQHAEIWSLYAHLDPRSGDPYSVRPGDSVVNGTVLGLKGDTGKSFGAHLHLEVGRGSWRGDSSRNYDVLFDSQTILDGAPNAPDIPTLIPPKTYLSEDDMPAVIYVAEGHAPVLAIGPKFWAVSNAEAESARVGGVPQVWLTKATLDALITDARASKTQGAAPLLLRVSGVGVIYTAHGGAVRLQNDDEVNNLKTKLGVPEMSINSQLANVVVTDLRNATNA